MIMIIPASCPYCGSDNLVELREDGSVTTICKCHNEKCNLHYVVKIAYAAISTECPCLNQKAHAHRFAPWQVGLFEQTSKCEICGHIKEETRVWE
ncbi:MAG: hypothetical protein ACRCWR_07000 [Saezia sp.]